MRIPLALVATSLALVQPGLAEAPQSASAPQARTLSSEEFDRYLAALDSMLRLRVEAQAEAQADAAPRPDADLQAEYVSQVQRLMTSNGFTAASFNTVHWNVMQAFAQVEIQANAADVERTLAQQRKALADSRSTLSESDYAEGLARIENTQALLEGRGGVPDPNVALVRTHLADLKATFERGMSGARSGYQRQPDATKR